MGRVVAYTYFQFRDTFVYFHEQWILFALRWSCTFNSFLNLSIKQNMFHIIVGCETVTQKVF